MKQQKVFDQMASKISNIPLIKYIRHGLMYTIPLLLVGSFAVLLLYLPSVTFQNKMDQLLGGHWRQALLFINDGTLHIISILVSISISYSMIANSNKIQKSNINYIMPVLVVLGCYITAMTNVDKMSTIKFIGTSGLFFSIIFSSLITMMFLWFYTHRIFKSKMVTQDGDMVLSQSLKILEPAFFTFFFVVLVKMIVLNLNLNQLFFDIYENTVQYFKQGKHWWQFGFLYTFLCQLLWFFGFHGGNILDPFNESVLYKSIQLNREWIKAGLEAQNVFTKEFFDVFVNIGGAGATVCLITALMISNKNKNSNRIAKISILPGIFNINELILFGLPIVLNPFLILPFFVTPLVLCLISAVAMEIGLVPVTQMEMIWTAPILINSYMTTGYSIQGVLLQLFNIAVGTSIYLPFVKMYEAHMVENSKKVLYQLLDEMDDILKEKSNSLINRKDEMGFLARSISKDIYNALRYNRNPFYLEYQPQLDGKGKIIGCEALLRWEHERFGRIPPPVIVAIADEAKYTDLLGNWVIDTAFSQLALWQENGVEDLVMSVNISSIQLKNQKFIPFVEKTIKKTGIDPKYMEFELTENITIDASDANKKVLKELKALGVRIAIDDFGMGHSSLLYIKDFFVDTVKLDGVLVKDIVTDEKSQEIVTTITKLCSMLDLNIVAEVVETQEQKNKLSDLGCGVYQGYLYSPSLKPERFVDYLEVQNKDFRSSDKK